MKKRIAIILMAIALLFVGCGKIEETKLVYKNYLSDGEWEIDILGNASRDLGMLLNQSSVLDDKIRSYPISIEAPDFLINEIQVNPDRKHHYDGKDHVFTALLSTNLENLSEFDNYKVSLKDIVLKINGIKMKPLKGYSDKMEIEKLSDENITIQYYTEKDISEIDTVEVTFKKLKKRLSIIVNK